MKNNFFKILSIITHPLLLPTYAVLILLYLPTNLILYPQKLKYVILGMTFLITFILPVLSIFILVSLRVVENFSLPQSKDRTLPMLLTASYFLTYYLMIDNTEVLSMTPEIEIFLLVSVISIFISIIINKKTKISAHAVGASLLLGFMLVFMFLTGISDLYLIIGLILIASLAGTARLGLNAHSPSQIYLGYFVGGVCGLSSIFFYF